MQHLQPNTTLQRGKYRIERENQQNCFMSSGGETAATAPGAQ